MKKKLFGTMVAVAAMFAGYSAYDAQRKNGLFGGILADVEAISACEITRKDNTVFKCTGEEGTCTGTKLGHTLTCSGTKVSD